MIAAAAMALSSLSVTTNANRLRTYQRPALATAEALRSDEQTIVDVPSYEPEKERDKKWLRKSEQWDKWNRCLIEGMIVLSETGARDEQTTPP